MHRLLAVTTVTLLLVLIPAAAAGEPNLPPPYPGGAVLIAAAAGGHPYTWTFPTGWIANTAPNCGATFFSGQTLDGNGAPLNGITVRVRSSDGSLTLLSSPSSGAGNWGVALGNTARAGNWKLWVEIDGFEQSPIIQITTQGPDQCAPGSGGVQTAVVNFSQQAGPALPPAQTPVDPTLLFPYSFVQGTQPNCGTTGIAGYLQDPGGNPVSGRAVRVINTDGSFSQLSGLADANGYWNVTVANQARAGLWQAWVDDAGSRTSPIVNIRTNGPENCQPGGSGVQTVELLFKQGSQPPAPPPNPPSPANYQYIPTVTSTASNCGATNISGRVADAGGNPLNGVVVRIQSDSGQYTNQMPSVQNGNWAFFLGASAIQGLWHLWVDDGNGAHLSQVVNVQTNGPGQCAAGSGGVQLVEIEFQRSA